MSTSKKILIVVLALLILAAGFAYYYWVWRVPAAPSAAEQAVDNIQKTVENIAQDTAKSALPNLDTSAVTNAAAEIPNTNPYSNTNPFSDIKTNPFK